MERISREDIEIQPIRGFSLIGDPGCDGLGVEIMSIFNAACHEAAGDFLLVAGDIVPNGADRFYQNVIDMTDAALHKPIYMLAGNHDKQNYEAYFGKKNYFIYNSELLLIVLDNSQRAFSPETLDVLRRALSYKRDCIILAFHIPPPNKVSGNSVSEGEWAKVLEIIAPVKDKVKYILCGHVHSYFEDEVNGIQLIATGGGGARIEEISGVQAPYHHYVEFYFDSDGSLHHAKKSISFNRSDTTPLPVFKALERAFEGECQAYIRYRLYAEDAKKNNKPGLAKLFLAASDSEYHHARNFYYAMNQFKSLGEAISESVSNESGEVNGAYLDGLNLARQHACGLAAYAFEDARSAEAVHLRLFEEAERLLSEASDIPEKQYHTCTSCGYTFSAMSAETVCPVCGAPQDKIVEVRYE
ncbi:MAG: metallophosphoesterase [Treponema sp.]|jgi:rubrerythrin/predicted phosphodiesterase|nr:metallophosphoesterase [Treponema sp.]